MVLGHPIPLGLPFVVVRKLLGVCPSKEKVCVDEEKEIWLEKGFDGCVYLVEIFSCPLKGFGMVMEILVVMEIVLQDKDMVELEEEEGFGQSY